MTKHTQRDRMWRAALETADKKRGARRWKRSFGATDVRDRMDDPASARSLRDLLATMADFGVIERASAQGKYLPGERESSSTKDQKDTSGPSTSTDLGGVTTSTVTASSSETMSGSDAALALEDETDQEDDQDAGSVDVDDLDLPGSGSTLEARKSAVRACYEYLRENETAQRSDFIEDVYPDHPARFGSSGGWWNAVGKEGFRELARRRDDLEAPSEGGHIWRYTG